MTRALRLGLSWAFDALDLDVVHWRANVGNWGSRRVAWACGFRFEGTVRSLLPQRGMRYDGWIASLLRGDPMTPASPWLEAPVVRGERVGLRPWQDSDLPRLAEQRADPATWTYLSAVSATFGIADAAGWLLRQRTDMAEGRTVSWCVADRVDDRMVGSVDLFGLDHHGNRVMCGYALHPDSRGRGLMTEAVRLAVRHAVIPVEDGGLGRHTVSLRIAAGNTASQAVAERVGFRPAGALRETDVRPDGTAEDLLIYDLLADEVITR